MPRSNAGIFLRSVGHLYSMSFVADDMAVRYGIR